MECSQMKSFIFEETPNFSNQQVLITSRVLKFYKYDINLKTITKLRYN